MDPAAYMKYHRIPNKFARHFIKEIAETTDWATQDLDLVMDIGCGPGNISTYWIDQYFPNIKRLIGLDMDPGMIALAKKQNKKDKIEYYVADIMNKDSLKEWEGKVSRILSNFMLHRVEDQKLSFKHIFDLLEPSGEAALSFIITGPYYRAFKDLLQTPKWNPILEPSNFVFPEAFVKKYNAATYKEMFEDVGFNVTYCEMKSWGFPYESDDECKNLLYSLHSIGYVTDGLIEEYKDAIFDQYMKYGFRDPHGFPVHELDVLHAKLRKDGKMDSQL